MGGSGANVREIVFFFLVTMSRIYAPCTHKKELEEFQLDLDFDMSGFLGWVFEFYNLFDIIPNAIVNLGSFHLHFST